MATINLGRFIETPYPQTSATTYPSNDLLIDLPATSLSVR
jgi:hypothetical protein